MAEKDDAPLPTALELMGFASYGPTPPVEVAKDTAWGFVHHGREAAPPPIRANYRPAGFAEMYPRNSDWWAEEFLKLCREKGKTDG